MRPSVTRTEQLITPFKLFVALRFCVFGFGATMFGAHHAVKL
jgi:hypothetical protein